ncbi:Hypothetical protein PBC10988_22120 [Planctomycetales bacterium 10988]|nr:Hypothetical protein PBC10988_22120 [Planctomycetales bacterium 10988]
MDTMGRISTGQPWVASLPKSAAAGLRQLRRLPQILLCEEAETLWLRGDRCDEGLLRSLRKVPGLQMFSLLKDQQLLPAGKAVPRGWLPGHDPEQPSQPLPDWQPISDWIPFQMQQAGLPAQRCPRLKLQLMRIEESSHHATHALESMQRATETEPSSVPKPCGMLVSVAVWKQFVTNASQVRLRALRFAVSSDGRVLVLGEPLPTLPASCYLWRLQRLLLPCGYVFDPPLEAALVMAICEVEPEEVALFLPSGEWEHVAEENFVPVTRSAVAATWPAVSDSFSLPPTEVKPKESPDG